MSEQSAHLVLATPDCTTPNCPDAGTEKGPGGLPYCRRCKARIYSLKTETERLRHGTNGGGALRQQLIGEARPRQGTDELARRLRSELSTLTRAAAARRLAEAKVHRARGEALATVAAIIESVREIADAPRVTR